MKQWKKEYHPRNAIGRFTRNGRVSSIVPGMGEPININSEECDIDSITAEIESDPKNASRILRQAIADGRLSTRVHRGNQDKHIPGTQNYKQEIANGREPSILTADVEYLIKKHAGRGIPQFTRKGKWTQKEMFCDDDYIGVYKNKRYSSSHKTHRGQIHYSNKGVHIVPEQDQKHDKKK